MYGENENINNIFKALGYKTRTDIVRKLSTEKDGLSLKELQDFFKIPIKTLFFHVNILKRAKILKTHKDKGYIFLTVNKSVFNEIIKFSKIF